jgi:tight adherence protein B
MTSLVALVAGALIGLGLFVGVAAWRGQLTVTTVNLRQRQQQAVVTSSGIAAWLLVWMLTRWPLVSAVIGFAAAMGMSAVLRHRHRRDDRTLVDAIAVWTEQLRDMLAGSNGLEQTIAATATHAPAPLRSPLERLVVSMSYSPLPTALQRFSRDINHPTADFVVAALSTAATRQVRELGALLGHLATCAREECRMYTRVWVGRSRTRSAVKIIASVVVIFVVGLAIVSPDYLAPYRSAEGQVVLSAVVLVFFGALLLMQRMSAVSAPERFVGRVTETGS